MAIRRLSLWPNRSYSPRVPLDLTGATNDQLKALAMLLDIPIDANETKADLLAKLRR